MEFDLNPPAIVGAAVAGQVVSRADDVRKKLKNLSTAISQSTFDMIVLLAEAETKLYPSQWGYNGIGDFAAAELGIKARRGQYLARIGNVCESLGVERQDYEPAGVSKLREITTLDPEADFFNKETKTPEPLKDHILRLIEAAPDMTVEDVSAEVARLKGQVGADARVMRGYSTDQASWDNVISPALEIARRKLGSAGRDSDGSAVEYTDGVCYESICADYLADPNNILEDVEPEEEQYPELPETQIQEETLDEPESGFSIPTE